MKSLLFLPLLLIATTSILQAQTGMPNDQNTDIQKAMKTIQDMKPKFGIKAGYNVAKVIGSTPNYSPDTKKGFMVSAFYAPASRSGLGYRTELVFSRQGFGFDEGGKVNSVTSDYIYLPQFTTFGITKFVQLQAGGQIGYLLKSSKANKGGSESGSQDITSFSNRIDYGAVAGVEVYPFKGLIFGGRYNYSFGNTYKQLAGSTMPVPFPLPFNPDEVKAKNAVINFYIGYRF